MCEIEQAGEEWKKDFKSRSSDHFIFSIQCPVTWENGRNKRYHSKDCQLVIFCHVMKKNGKKKVKGRVAIKKNKEEYFVYKSVYQHGDYQLYKREEYSKVEEAKENIFEWLIDTTKTIVPKKNEEIVEHWLRPLSEAITVFNRNRELKSIGVKVAPIRIVKLKYCIDAAAAISFVTLSHNRKGQLVATPDDLENPVKKPWILLELYCSSSSAGWGTEASTKIVFDTSRDVFCYVDGYGRLHNESPNKLTIMDRSESDCQLIRRAVKEFLDRIA